MPHDGHTTLTPPLAAVSCYGAVGAMGLLNCYIDELQMSNQQTALRSAAVLTATSMLFSWQSANRCLWGSLLFCMVSGTDPKCQEAWCVSCLVMLGVLLGAQGVLGAVCMSWGLQVSVATSRCVPCCLLQGRFYLLALVSRCPSGVPGNNVQCPLRVSICLLNPLFHPFQKIIPSFPG